MLEGAEDDESNSEADRRRVSERAGCGPAQACGLKDDPPRLAATGLNSLGRAQGSTGHPPADSSTPETPPSAHLAPSLVLSLATTSHIDPLRLALARCD